MCKHSLRGIVRENVIKNFLQLFLISLGSAVHLFKNVFSFLKLPYHFHVAYKGLQVAFLFRKKPLVVFSQMSQLHVNQKELISFVSPLEQRLSQKHLCQNAAKGPNIDSVIVVLIIKVQLWGPVILRNHKRRPGTRLESLRTTKVANLQVVFVVDQNVFGLQISVHDFESLQLGQTNEKLPA